MALRSRFLVGPLVTGALVSACSDDGTSGALDQSSTRAECAPEDTACQADGLDAPLAVGARLSLDTRITADGVAAPKLTLETARADVLGVEGITLTGKAAGWASVLMLDENGLVLDFVTMTVSTPDRLELYRLTASGSQEASPMPAKIQLAPDDDFEVVVKPWSGATRLLGNVDATWTLAAPATAAEPSVTPSIDASTVVTVLDSGRPASRRLRIKQPGTVTLTVEGAGFKKTLDLEVLP